MRRIAHAALALWLGLSACGAPATKKEPLGKLPRVVTSAVPLWIPFSVSAGQSVADDPREIRLTALRQLTTDGTSSAPVWHPSSRSILYESGHSATSCGQVFRVDLQTGTTERISPAEGWAGAGAFAGERVLYAHGDQAKPPCSPVGNRLEWTLPAADIYAATTSAATTSPGSAGAAPVALISGPGYDAEPSATLDGSRLVFTSTRDGNPEIYAASGSGADLLRITTHAGYDGLARYSPDGSKLVWSAEHALDAPPPGPAPAEAGAALAPAHLLILMAGARGQHPRVIANQGQYSMASSFMPDSRRVLFTSSFDDATGGTAGGSGNPGVGNFDTYLVDPDGPVTATGAPRVERITFIEGYDGEASVSPDGRYVVFTSSRLAQKPGETNIFLARWHDE